MSRTAIARTPAQVRRLTTAAFFGPPLIVASSLLIANPDWEAYGIVGGTLALIATLTLVAIAAPGAWLTAGGAVLGTAALVAPGFVLHGEVLAHQGQKVDVRVTSVTVGHGRNGQPADTCHLARVDGKPLKHAWMDGDFCDGPGTVGETEQVLVDPYGWSSPQPADTDYGGIDVAAGAAAAVPLLLGLVIRRARRNGLRRTAAAG
ncbi:hypothetical protein [Streptomyces sp. NRRL S-350]|uniref:hypothetical protein n=1 Tax=Streptomyces sp. NRRL S-350 TaxID=1463902 RepID=UPI0004C19F3F|nr:hypothetical protein [Streptomyces sp. NRRL S-350]